MNETKHWKMDQVNFFNLLTTDVPYHIETNKLICDANQLAGFYMMGNIGRYWVKEYLPQILFGSFLNILRQILIDRTSTNVFFFFFLIQ